MKWIDVSNKVKHRKYSREVSDKYVHRENRTIDEILLSEKNLYYRPWHVVVVVDLLIMAQLFFVLSFEYITQEFSIEGARVYDDSRPH